MLATNQPAAKTTAPAGPLFRFVEETTWEQLQAAGGFAPRASPLLIKGAVKAWPAWQRWSFEQLAELKKPDGSPVTTSFQNGLVEQGVTREPLIQPVAPYLRELARLGSQPIGPDTGLLSSRRRAGLAADATFHLDWSHMANFTPDKPYLAQWDILEEFPELRDDFAIRTVWPGWRWTWEYVFMGPANTVTGFHFDFPNNWFCQVRGTKEFLLFPPEQTPHMSQSLKYDWGATLSDIDISRLDQQPAALERFSRAEGLYARVEAGDALFVPKETWHAVVALEPSISLAVFGLKPSEILVGGGKSTIKDLLHQMHLYRWGNCTCHTMHKAA